MKASRFASNWSSTASAPDPPQRLTRHLWAGRGGRRRSYWGTRGSAESVGVELGDGLVWLGLPSLSSRTMLANWSTADWAHWRSPVWSRRWTGWGTSAHWR